MNISKVSLDEVFWFQEGPGVRNWQFQKEGIKLLNVANIEKNGQLNLGKTDRYLAPDEANGKYAHFLLDEGDLVIASSGISFDTDGMLRTRGAFVEREHLPLCLNTSTIRFKPKDGRSDLKFLRHWLDGSEFRGQITKLVTGSAQQNFGPTHLKALRISVPPLEEQRRIAAILDQAETLRTQRRTALALLDSLTQSLFLDMFGDPVANPREFEIKPLADVTKFENGDRSSNYPSGDDLKTSGVLFLSTKNIVNNTLDLSQPQYITEEKFSSLSRGKALSGDLIITLRGTLGSCCIFDGGHKTAFINAQMMLIRPTVKVLSVYLHALLTSDNAKAHFDYIGRGAAVPQLTSAQLAELKVLVPPLPLQQTFATRIAAIEALKATHRRALAALDALFASLQQRAFAGAL